MTTAQMLLTIVVAGAATLIARALPFVAFPAGKTTPPYIRYLGQILPGAVFGLLVIYCLREVDLFAGTHGIPELAGILVTALLYLWRRNMLLAIFGGTALYMLLVNLVFV